VFDVIASKRQPYNFDFFLAQRLRLSFALLPPNNLTPIKTFYTTSQTCLVRLASSLPRFKANNTTAPDYYKVLEVQSTATQPQIREAYKKAALKHHPDRVPSDSPERTARTKKFQAINDAYYTLSDPTRRRDYDATRSFHSFTGHADPDEEEIPRPSDQGSAGFGGWGDFFKSTFGSNTPQEESQRSNAQFSSVFEEMMQDEGMAEGETHQPTGKFWSLVGGLSGGAMGFIIANFPGAVAGAVAGNRLGAVRDTKGKSVYAVFQELPQADKAKMLSDLAARVFAHAVGSG
jgi:hypothetical protein